MNIKTLILTLLLPFGLFLAPLPSPAQWFQQNSGTDLDLKSICFTDSENGWAVGSGGIILHTSDGGDNWIQQSSGTENDLTSVRFMNADSGIILHTENGGIVGIEKFKVQSSKFKVDCFPNPVSEISNIKYQIPDRPKPYVGGFNIEYVTVSVFDIYGKEIMTLVDEIQPAGEYLVQFNVADLPAGLYFIRLQAGKESVTGKMVKIGDNQ